MRKTNESVYRCDYCNKAIISAGFMKVHERMCRKNPLNQHQCFKFCKNLVKEQEINKEENYHSRIKFTCEKRPGIKLYSYKLERFKSNNGRLKGMERMPLECEFYESLPNHDFE